MSPRAALRLERFGFDVYDYTAGKADWLAAGLAGERGVPAPARALEAVTRDVTTCALDTPVAEVVRALHAAHHDTCLVLDEQRVVLGRVRIGDLEHVSPTVAVEQLMHPGPATIRADADLEQTRRHLRERNVTSIIVTTPEGELLGLLHADHAPGTEE